MKNKVLITGGTGFLGKNVVRLFRENGFRVYSCSRSENNIDLLNLSVFQSFLKKIKPHYLIHCAARVGGIAYNAKYPVEVFEDNIKIGLNVVRACNSVGVKNFLNIMPNCVYPGDMEEYKESKWWDGPIHETVLTYGLPRKMIWGACFAYCQKNIDFKPVHLIFPNMYGPDDHFDPIRSHALGALLSKIIKAKKNNKKIVEIWGDGSPIREWIYVEDAAQAILKTIQNLDKFKANEIMNIGIGKGISIKQLAYLIKNIVGWKGKFVFDKSKPNGAMKKILIADKMFKIIKWKPSAELKEGITKTVILHRKYLKDI